MDTTLAAVTLLSMFTAMTLSVVVWRMLRHERRRSDARVTALAELAAQPDEIEAPLPPPEPRRPATHAALRSPAPRPRPIAPADGMSAQAGIDLPLNAPAPAEAMTASLFEEPEQSSPWTSRFGIMAALALVVTAVALIALTVQDHARGAARATAPPKGTAAAANATAGVLELLSLRDAREPGRLTVTGLVQNPSGGTPLNRVSVTAFAFDERGAFLASGRALLDVTALAPGDESPFVVTVPVAGDVARYRVGFRTEDGRVLAHVDKRQAPSAGQIAQRTADPRGTS